MLKIISYIAYILILIGVFAHCSHEINRKKRACMDVQLVRNGKLISVDSCFTAPTSDSLDKMILAIQRRQSHAHESYETKLFFIIVDTLQKKPNQYEYAIVVSNAGTIEPDVVITNDLLLVKEKMASMIKENIIFRKVKTGESIPALVETIFKTNVRINWRREGTNSRFKSY